jgi:glycosyltransferase involved in cell wall biosynthesis
MASGTPVVTTPPRDHGGRRRRGRDRGARQPCELAGGIERALADRERLVAAGLERARRYSWAETARLTLDVYRELL